MNRDLVRGVFEASEHSWESTAEQWVTVFDAVTKAPDGSLASIEAAAWNTYTQARDLRKLVSSLWLEAQAQARTDSRNEIRLDTQPETSDDRWITE